MHSATNRWILYIGGAVTHWRAMLILSKDCGTQRRRKTEKVEECLQERPENVAPYFE